MAWHAPRARGLYPPVPNDNRLSFNSVIDQVLKGSSSAACVHCTAVSVAACAWRCRWRHNFSPWSSSPGFASSPSVISSVNHGRAKSKKVWITRCITYLLTYCLVRRYSTWVLYQAYHLRLVPQIWWFIANLIQICVCQICVWLCSEVSFEVSNGPNANLNANNHNQTQIWLCVDTLIHMRISHTQDTHIIA